MEPEITAAPCLFCERLAGRDFYIPLEERPHAVAFVANHQRSRGSVIVIPRRHVRSLPELTEEEALELFRVIRRVAAAIELAYDPDGLNVWQRTLDSAPHFHLRMCPRYEGQPYTYGPNYTLPLTPLEEREAVASTLTEALRSIPEDRF
jgi:histidine triad (HIT) family protein